MTPRQLRRLAAWYGWPVVVSVAAVACIAWTVDLRRIPQVVKRVNWSLMLAAAGVYLTSSSIRALRWYLLIRRRKFVPFLLLLQLNFIGMLSSAVLPSSLGEDAIRISILGRHIESAADAISATLLDRITGVLALAIVAGLGVSQLRQNLPESLTDLAHSASTFRGLAFVLSAALFVLLLIWLSPWKHLLRTYLARLFKDTWQVVEGYLTRPAVLAVSVLISFAFPMGAVLANYLVAQALEIPMTLSILSLVLPVILILASLPVSLGNGLGLREGLYMLMLQPFGVLPEQALALAVITRVVLLLATLGSALPYMLLQPHSRDERRLASVPFRLRRPGGSSHTDLVDGD